MKIGRSHRFLAWAAAAAALVALLFVPLPWKHTTRIHTEAIIDRTPADVYAYVTTPGYWPRWHPSSLAVRGATDHSLEVGEQVTEEFIVAGRRGEVVWTVSARDPRRRWSIRGQVAGGGEGVVSYTLTPAGSGTRFERDFDYAFGSLLLIILDRVEIRGRVEAESAQAVRRLQAILQKG